MKKMIFAAIAMTMILSASPAFAGNYSRRAYSQQQRINSGINNGSISPRELANLNHRQARLNAASLRDAQDGRGLTRAERYKLNRRADNISRSIYQFKRN